MYVFIHSFINVRFIVVMSRPPLGSTQPPIQWVPGALSRG
jgi:hypothetical protein